MEKCPTNPVIIPYAQHNISKKSIKSDVLKILTKLKQAGYEAYMVGGCIRDLVLGQKPKDFDLATNASPQAIHALFKRRCRLIGRRFRLAHIYCGKDIVEVSTFRATADHGDTNQQTNQDGRIIRDNVYSNDIDDDVWRRDFTINALFYDISDCSIIDFVGGMADLKDGYLRLIGDPKQRYVEDPVRMLRAIRFATKLNLRIHPDSETALKDTVTLINDVPHARLINEILKLFISGKAEKALYALQQYHLFEHLFPQTHNLLNSSNGEQIQTFLVKAMQSTDLHYQSGMDNIPAFLFSVLLWHPTQQLAKNYHLTNHSKPESLQQATLEVLSKQRKTASIPRRSEHIISGIYALQFRLQNTAPNLHLLQHKRFKDAYDFLSIRVAAGEFYKKQLDEWQALIDEHPQLISKPKKHRQPWLPKS